MLRFPRPVLDLPAARRYCRGESARARAKGDFLILSFASEDEPGEGWDDDGSGWLASGVKKGHLIESALRHHLRALHELPADVLVPPRLVLTHRSFGQVVERFARPGSPRRRSATS